jgi:photosystem II stability/assembly factor-like uncharacterized protein
MTKAVCKLGLIFILATIMTLGTGCSKSKEATKKIDIKVITPENVHGVMAPDDNNIWITGNYGTIFHSSDGGETWVEQDSKIEKSILCDGIFLDNKTGWVVGTYGTIIHTSDGGETWTKQNPGTDRHLFGIFFLNKDLGWAVGEWGTIIHTKDGGITWNSQVEEADKALNNIAFHDENIGWAVGEQGTIMHTADGGNSWAIQQPAAFYRETLEDYYDDQPPGLFCVKIIDKNTVFAVGMNAAIMHTSDMGKTWNQLPVDSKLALYTIFFKDNLAWAVGDMGLYLTSEDSGKTWSVHDEVIKSKFWFRDVFFSSPTKGWVVGQAGTVVRTNDSGKTWEFRSGLSYDMDFFEMPKALEFGGGTE